MYIKYHACVNINSFDVIKSLDLTNQMKSMFATTCNSYFIIQCRDLLYKFAKTYYSAGSTLNYINIQQLVYLYVFFHGDFLQGI